MNFAKTVLCAALLVVSSAQAKAPVAGESRLNEANNAFAYGDQPFNPRLFEALSTGLADRYPGPVAVDVGGSQDSNRYFAEISPDNTGGRTSTVPTDDDPGSFAYRHLGQLANGQHVVQTWADGGGTGVFVNLLLVDFVLDRELDAEGKVRERLDMRRRGEISLTAGYDGEVTLLHEANQIRIGAGGGTKEQLITLP